jgi:flagellar protein FlgJ
MRKGADMDVKATAMNSLDQSMIVKAEDVSARGSKAKDIAQVKKLAQDFESVFLEQMFRSMRSSVQKSGLVDGGNAEEIYTSMLDSEYAKQMSSQGNSGLAQMIERQLLQTMGVKSAASPLSARKAAVHNYEKAGGVALRPDRKEVTINSDVIPGAVDD